MRNLFRDWYKEDDKSESKCPSESGVEIFLFYISLLLLVVFSIIVLYFDTFTLRRRYLVLFIPILIWIFLRSSRKDMNATAHWVAGLLGAIGGAGSVLLLRIFLKQGL